jgi:uncharacterized delta-60 repeat protein
MEVARFNASGTLDTTFNSAGPVPGTMTITFAGSTGIYLRGLAIYPSTGTDTADYGKIEMAGEADYTQGGINTEDVALARCNADGTADSSFGQSGQVVTPIPSPNGLGRAWATAIQADGKIVAAGETADYPVVSGHWAFSLLRYNRDGSLDTTFGSGGIVTTPNGTGDSRAYGVAIQSDGRIVAAGFTNSFGDFMTARYLPGPEIGTFTASASTVTAGSILTLTASNLSDGDPSGSGYATITQVAFYAVDSSGHQTLLGYGAFNNGTWILNYTASLTTGSYTLFAQATDSDGIVGDSAFLSLAVQ